MPKADSNNVHAGHRARLRTRYRRCGLDDFQEHEVLELLLFHSIPRANTNPIAHNLLNRFGSLFAVLNASEEELCEVDGVGPASAALIRTVADTARAAKLKEIGSAPLTHWEKLYMFSTEWFLGKLPSTVAVILMDKTRKILTVRTLAEEHLRRPETFHEEILRLCQQVGAVNAVLMHNHVDGAMRPSGEDLYTTIQIFRYLAENNVTLLEHIIVHELNVVACLDDAMQEKVSGFPK